MKINILKTLLSIGAGFFLLMSIAHALDLKIPGLFIYYNIPSYAYQNKIISLLSFGWSTFFFVAATTLSKKMIQAILVSGALAIAMLFAINMSGGLAVLARNKSITSFNIQVGALFIYWIAVLVAYKKSKL